MIVFVLRVIDNVLPDAVADPKLKSIEPLLLSINIDVKTGFIFIVLPFTDNLIVEVIVYVFGVLLVPLTTVHI